MADRLCACLALILLAPLMALTALIIKLASPGPVFYQARRVGQGGKPLIVPKFRSMHHRPFQGDGPAFTLPQDSRIHAFGQFIRLTKLDELPQLWLVLKGDMALIGPRPEEEATVARYQDWMRGVLQVKPGLSSRGSLYDYKFGKQYLNGENPDTIYADILMPILLAFELDFERHRAFGASLCMVVETLWVMALISCGRRSFPAPANLARVAAFLESVGRSQAAGSLRHFHGR